jgi:hypothetical protein
MCAVESLRLSAVAMHSQGWFLTSATTTVYLSQHGLVHPSDIIVDRDLLLRLQCLVV